MIPMRENVRVETKDDGDEPHPPHYKVLKAVSTIEKYTNDLLPGKWRLFWVRSVVLTDFFKRS